MFVGFHKNNITNFIAFLMFVCTIIIYAKEDGIVGRTQKNRKGCTCHNEFPSNDVVVLISGPDTLNAGESAIYSVVISGATKKAAGINIAVSDGELYPVSRDLKKLKGELTHTSPKYFSSGKVIFEFSYSAPQIGGEQSLYVSANTVDTNGKKTGDAWNYAPIKKIIINNHKS